jgi:hypothetical protein
MPSKQAYSEKASNSEVHVSPDIWVQGIFHFHALKEVKHRLARRLPANNFTFLRLAFRRGGR